MMPSYEVLKLGHIVLVVSSVLLFLWRGWLAQDPAAVLPRFWRWLPHTVDTVLVLSALGLLRLSNGLWWTSVYWLKAKLVVLLVYVVLGSIAVKRGRNWQVRQHAYVGALGCVVLMISLAVLKPF